MDEQTDIPLWPPNNTEEVMLWLNARADGECTPAQEAWLADYVQKDEACAREWAALERTRLALECARLAEPTDLERRALARALAPRSLETLGWILFGVGSITLGAYIAWQLGNDQDVPLSVRLGFGALTGGLLLLLIRVGWERLRVRRIDPYRDVQR